MATFKRMTFVSFYDDLGLSPNASSVEIRERFLLLAKASDPDRPGLGASLDRFKRVIAAYYVLRDFERRRRYDAYLATQIEFDPFVGGNNSSESQDGTERRFEGRQKAERPDTTYRYTFERKSKTQRETPSQPAAENSTPEPVEVEVDPEEPELAMHAAESIDQPAFQVPFPNHSSKTYRRSRRGLPWTAVLTQVVAILFGAVCALALAHYILLWIEPETGGLTRFLK